MRLIFKLLNCKVACIAMRLLSASQANFATCAVVAAAHVSLWRSPIWYFESLFQSKLTLHVSLLGRIVTQGLVKNSPKQIVVNYWFSDECYNFGNEVIELPINALLDYFIWLPIFELYVPSRPLSMPTHEMHKFMNKSCCHIVDGVLKCLLEMNRNNPLWCF